VEQFQLQLVTVVVLIQEHNQFLAHKDKIQYLEHSLLKVEDQDLLVGQQIQTHMEEDVVDLVVVVDMKEWAQVQELNLLHLVTLVLMDLVIQGEVPLQAPIQLVVEAVALVLQDQIKIQEILVIGVLLVV
jgi:hypothetical protein